MRELIVAVFLLSLLAGSGAIQRKYEKWKSRDECAELVFLLDTGQYDKAHWYVSRGAEFLRGSDPEEARRNCD